MMAVQGVAVQDLRKPEQPLASAFAEPHPAPRRTAAFIKPHAPMPLTPAIDLAKLLAGHLHFSPDAGHIQLFDQRMLLMQAESFAELRRAHDAAGVPAGL